MSCDGNSIFVAIIAYYKGHTDPCRPSAQQRLAAFAATGKVKAGVELQPLSAINDIFSRLEHGKVASRVVLDFSEK